ncbi:MAG TPA: tetratricopeptide repeat protein, partial [Candidatus Polarisedimenticolia bacterium]|nr:tetratricopeptide repeat protein [Candidatus Polarisedimenticolia bacterium]
LERIDPSINPLAFLPLPRRIVAALALSGRYLLYLLVPVVTFRDHAGYAQSAPLRPFAAVWAVTALLLLLAWVGAAVLLSLRRDRAAAPLAFSLASFLPASNLVVPIASLYALNFLYMPLLGLTLAVGGAADRRARVAAEPPGDGNARWSPRAWFVPGLVILLAGLSFREAGIWRDEVSLFTFWTRRFRHYATAYSHLGAALLTRGDASAAIPPLRKALAIDDRSADAHYDLGAALVRAAMPAESSRGEVRGDERASGDKEMRSYLEDALTETRAALHLAPELVPALVNESKILLMLGRPAEAENAARAALGIAPAYPPALENLGAALYRQTRYAEAAAEFSEMIRLDPTDRSARSRYIVALLEAGDLESARRAALAARSTFPDNTWFDFCLARVEARAGHETEALGLLRSIVVRRPGARAWLAEESDFDAFRGDPAFRKLLER